MSRERASLSRRKLLGSVGAVGALSGVAGAGTWALFEDDETFPGSLAAGEVGVSIACSTSCSDVEDGTVSFDLDGLSPDTGTSTERFSITAEANPVRAWLRSNCPAPVDPLGDAIEVQLFYDDDCGEVGETKKTKIYPTPESSDSWSTLNGFLRWLRSGLRLDDLDDQPCFDGTLCLDLEYRLRGDWAQGLSTELTFEVVAEQCRHVDEGSVASPFPPSDCIEPECRDCVEIGTVDVTDNQLVPGETYPLDDPTYAIEVLTVKNKVDGDKEETVCASFALLANGTETDAPPLCSVTIKGGNGTVTYEGDDLRPLSTRTPGELCSPGDSNSAGSLPAISNITISVCGEVSD